MRNKLDEFIQYLFDNHPVMVFLALIFVCIPLFAILLVFLFASLWQNPVLIAFIVVMFVWHLWNIYKEFDQ